MGIMVDEAPIAKPVRARPPSYKVSLGCKKNRLEGILTGKANIPNQLDNHTHNEHHGRAHNDEFAAKPFRRNETHNATKEGASLERGHDVRGQGGQLVLGAVGEPKRSLEGWKAQSAPDKGRAIAVHGRCLRKPVDLHADAFQQWKLIQAAEKASTHGRYLYTSGGMLDRGPLGDETRFSL